MTPTSFRGTSGAHRRRVTVGEGVYLGVSDLFRLTGVSTDFRGSRQIKYRVKFLGVLDLYLG